MEQVTKIGPEPVERSPEGWWVHPAFSAFLDGREWVTTAEFHDWLNRNGLRCSTTYFDVDEDTPEAREWSKSGTFAGWEPERPDGEGWFIGSIHESEDEGPLCVWFRQKEG